MKYVKKRIPVEAFQYGVESFPYWFTSKISDGTVFSYRDNKTQKIKVIIKTLEGNMEIVAFDYIIQGIEGEIYPCKKDIFEATYEKYIE